jgi:methylthioribose-1-phosphate isomerase
MAVKTIEWKEGKVIILDQSRLPSDVIFIECTGYHEVADAIKRLVIRGAPAIGIAAAMGVALGALGIETEDAGEFRKRLDPVFTSMLDTRPTAVNIQWVVNRLRRLLDAGMDVPVQRLKEMLVEEGKRILDEDVEVNKAIGRYGADLIKDGDTILTHCNAGALATGGYGTATAPLFVAREQGKTIQVIADETRPVLQGARLTAWELMQAGIPVTLITDNAAGALMKNGEVDLVIVGTDRTVRNGDVANKIGTYPLAILSREHGIPFYVAAPLSSIDLSIPSGEQIPIEERDPAEVTQITGKVVSGGHGSFYGTISIAPKGVRARNIAFDVTPSRYITAIITENGVFRPDEIAHIKDEP